MSNKKLLSYWKKILKLNDWKIKLVENCCQQDMSSSVDVSGEVEYDDVNSCAVIRMLDKKYYGKRILPYDFEKTLVHELLHIKFWFLDRSDNLLQNREVHKLIDELAVAFVSVRNLRSKK